MRKKEAEREGVLEELAKRAHLAEAEKEELFSKMRQITKELDEAKRESRRLTRNMMMHVVENSSRNEALESLQRRLDDSRPRGIDPRSRRGSYGYLFQEVASDLPQNLYRELEHFGYIQNGNLTIEAINLLNHRDRYAS